MAKVVIPGGAKDSPSDEDQLRAAICQRTLVIIPALNEAETLPGVLENLKRWSLAGIRVVDNGSTDDTVALAQRNGAEVIHEAIRGYGAACWSGMQDLPEFVEWVLFCDADGSDDLCGLAPFFQAAAEGNVLVLGNRNAHPESRRALTWPQRFGNTLAGHLIWLRWGTRFADLGPLRGPKNFPFWQLKDNVKQGLEQRRYGVAIDVDGVAKSLAAGGKMREMLWIASFTPDESEWVTASQNEGVFQFDTTDTEVQWVAELKPLHAQRIAAHMGTDVSRVGLVESEWLRLFCDR